MSGALAPSMLRYCDIKPLFGSLYTTEMVRVQRCVAVQYSTDGKRISKGDLR